jgi:hypothetical protein
MHSITNLSYIIVQGLDGFVLGSVCYCLFFGLPLCLGPRQARVHTLSPSHHIGRAATLPR